MNVLEQLAKIKCIVLDIDGVLTNGQLYLQENGAMLRAMNIKDGFAMQWAVKKGYKIIVVSGGTCESCKERLEKLGIEQVFIGVKNKIALLEKVLQELNIDKATTLYMGDDLPDLEAMQYCGMNACPQDACVDVKMIAQYISPIKGGEGCVRDVLEKILRPNGDWAV